AAVRSVLVGFSARDHQQWHIAIRALGVHVLGAELRKLLLEKRIHRRSNVSELSEGPGAHALCVGRQLVARRFVGAAARFFEASSHLTESLRWDITHSQRT